MKAWSIQCIYVLGLLAMDALLRNQQGAQPTGADLPPGMAQWLCVLLLLDALNHPRLLALNEPSPADPPPGKGSASSWVGGLLITVLLMRVILLMSMLVVPALRAGFDPGTTGFKIMHSAAALLILLLECRMLGWLLVPRPLAPSLPRELWAHLVHALLSAALLLQLLRWPQLREFFGHIHHPASVAGLLLALLLNLFWFVMLYVPIRLADLGGQLRRSNSPVQRLGVLLLAYALMIYALRD